MNTEFCEEKMRTIDRADPPRSLKTLGFRLASNCKVACFRNDISPIELRFVIMEICEEKNVMQLRELIQPRSLKTLGFRLASNRSSDMI